MFLSIGAMLPSLGSVICARSISHFAASSSAPAFSSTFETVTGIQLTAAFLTHARRTFSQRPQSAASATDAAPQGTAPTPAVAETLNPQTSVESRQRDDGLEAVSVYEDAPQASQHLVPAAETAAPSRGLPAHKVPPHVLQDLRPPVQPYQIAPKLAQRPTPTPALYTPWTPTRALQRRSKLSRRMDFLIDVLEREQMQRVEAARPMPEFRAGDVLEVRMMIPEAERKVALYRGVCIARYDKGLRSSFKIYNVFPDCGGVVQHIPLYMPDLLGIKVVGRIPAKQDKLYYLLERESSEHTFQQGVATAK